jgi:hypothetical protein
MMECSVNRVRYDSITGYTIQLSEQDVIHLVGALQIAIKHLKQTNPNNPNIEILENLLRKFEPM